MRIDAPATTISSSETLKQRRNLITKQRSISTHIHDSALVARLSTCALEQEPQSLTYSIHPVWCENIPSIAQG